MLGFFASIHPVWPNIEDNPMDYGSAWWWIYGGISVFLVLLAGIMSGLTLGLMSLGLVDLEVLQRSGTKEEKKQAATILPVVQKQHQLLVTLLLCNAAAMEALPIFLDNMFNEVVAVILSVTFVLAFGEVIPQAICSRYGLAVGANFVWLVKILMWVCWPVTYPVGRILDYLLGHDDSALFRRAQLKALVSIHGKEAGKGGDLTHDETTIINGALDLTEKTAEEAMTPIESTFSLDANSKLDWEALGKILARGHSRVPVYAGNPRNIIGLLLVKSLLTVRAEAEIPVSAISIRRMPRVPANMPLYDILNEFQKGSSHMAAVVKTKGKRHLNKRGSMLATQESAEKGSEDLEVIYADPEKGFQSIQAEMSSVQPGDSQPEISCRQGEENGKREPSQVRFKESAGPVSGVLDEAEEGEVIGIITMEDVMEELLQEEIVDETDEYIDVHKRIRVAAAAAAQLNRGSSLVRRVGSSRGPIMRLSKQGQQAVNKVWKAEQETWAEATGSGRSVEDSLSEPLLGTSQ